MRPNPTTPATDAIILQNMNELRRIKLSASALTDPAFYRWCAWFAFNGLWPGRDERNHEAQRNLGAYSVDCLQRLKVGRLLIGRPRPVSDVSTYVGG